MALFGFGKKKDPSKDLDKENISGQDQGAGESASQSDLLYSLCMDALNGSDPSAAFQYFQQAEAAGHAGAAFQLGLMYETGNEVDQDKEKAAEFYLKAAEQGDAAAMFNYGYLLYNGQAGQADKEGGLSWILKAADAGDEAASEFAASLQNMKAQEEKKAEMARKKALYLKNFKNIREYYCLISQVTRHPFLVRKPGENDVTATFYEKASAAEAAAAALLSEDKKTTVQKVDKNALIGLIGNLYIVGANAADFVSEEETYHVYLYEIARRRVPANMPKGQLPLENPAVQANMLLYMQEFRRQAVNPDKLYRFNLDQQFSASLKTAKFLMPFVTNPKKPGEVQLLLLKNNQTQESVIPIFTDGMEYEAFRAGKKFNVAQRTFEQLAQMPLPEQVRGFLINASHAAAPLPQDFMQKALKNTVKTV